MIKLGLQLSKRGESRIQVSDRCGGVGFFGTGGVGGRQPVDCSVSVHGPGLTCSVPQVNSSEMANQVMIEDLKSALMAARPDQLNSHSTLKAAEALLSCLR